MEKSKNTIFILFLTLIGKIHIIGMRKKLPEEQKRKKVSFTIDPRVFEVFEKYCQENGIENYSSYIEKIIIDNLNKK
jgi:hypothetical protein